MYDPNLWGPFIAVGSEAEAALPVGAKCDNHPERFAFNIAVATVGIQGMSGADMYLYRECFLNRRSSPQRHDREDRREVPPQGDR